MTSDDRTNTIIIFYGQNNPENMCHTTQMWPLIIVTIRDLALTMTFN